MDKIIGLLAAPGRKNAVSHTALTLLPDGLSGETGKEAKGISDGSAAKQVQSKTNVLNRCIDRIVHFSGSEFVFLSIVLGLLAWSFLGIPYGTSLTWAVIISDIQAIICYMFDSLLMRQQFLEYDRVIQITAQLQSRLVSHKRMLRQVSVGNHPCLSEKKSAPQDESSDRTATTAAVPIASWIHKVSDTFAQIAGHMITVGLYCVCIVIWLAFGPSQQWSNQWQLYINSSTSAFMLLVFAILANIRERRGGFTNEYLERIVKVDCDLELQLRTITGDVEENPEITIPAPKMTRGQRAIFYYADFVGTLVGVLIMIGILIAWVAIGPALQFNSNWWLLIGTYAGLIGLHDGFVLDNVQMCLDSYIHEAMENVLQGDAELRGLLSVIMPSEAASDHTPEPKRSLNQRISEKFISFCGKPLIVLADMILIVGLIITASILNWSITGQLLCNIPPSIIESFTMLIVITGHNIADEKRQQNLKLIHESRVQISSKLS